MQQEEILLKQNCRDKFLADATKRFNLLSQIKNLFAHIKQRLKIWLIQPNRFLSAFETLIICDKTHKSPASVVIRNIKSATN